MPHRDGDDTAELHPVASDQPGLVLHRPYRKLRQIAVVYALLPLVCAGLGGFVVVQLAEANTDRRLATLERELQQRRTTNAQGNAERDRQIAELRRLVCIFADHAQPRDAQVDEVRARYGCNGGPYPGPSVAPPPSPGSPRPGVSGSSWAVVPYRTTAAVSRPAPTPSPVGPPSPAPSGRGPLLCVDLPLLPMVCV